MLLVVENERRIIRHLLSPRTAACLLTFDTEEIHIILQHYKYTVVEIINHPNGVCSTYEKTLGKNTDKNNATTTIKIPTHAPQVLSRRFTRGEYDRSYNDHGLSKERPGKTNVPKIKIKMKTLVSAESVWRYRTYT